MEVLLFHTHSIVWPKKYISKPKLTFFIFYVTQLFSVNATMCRSSNFVFPTLGTNIWSQRGYIEKSQTSYLLFDSAGHGLRTPREEVAFTARPKIQSQSQIFRYGRSIFCLPHRPNFSDILDLCLHWVSVVRAPTYPNIRRN